MMVTRAEAVEAIRSTSLGIADGDLSGKKVYEALNMADHLEPSKRQPILMELAMRLWLRKLLFDRKVYPEFEGFLWAHFAGKDDLKSYVLKAMDEEEVGASAMAVYCSYLRGMFAASGKTRSEFYRTMFAEAGIRLELSGTEFGDSARAFYRMADKSVHKEHLLVFYSVGLLLKVFKARHPGSDASATEEEIETMYRYFERNFPLGAKFVSSTKNDVIFKLSLDSKSLYERN